MPHAAANAHAIDDGEDDVLGGAARWELAVDLHGHLLERSLGKRLRGEDVLDFRGADAESDGSEGTVGGGMTVAADDGHTGLGHSLLRPNDVNNALAHVIRVVEGDAEGGGVLAESGDLLLGEWVRVGLNPVVGGDVVIGRRQREVRSPDLAAAQAEPFEGLRRGDLMHEVQIDIEQIGLTVDAPDEMVVPDLLGQGARLRHDDAFHAARKASPERDAGLSRWAYSFAQIERARPVPQSGGILPTLSLVNPLADTPAERQMRAPGRPHRLNPVSARPMPQNNAYLRRSAGI